MDDEIGIAANRRREVRVGLGRQPEVADVHRVVARLLHRPQHQERDRPLLRRAADLLDELLEVRRLDAAAGGAPRLKPSDVTNSSNSMHLERIRRLVNAVERRHVVASRDGGPPSRWPAA